MHKDYQVLVLIQARYNSTRFPGKVLKKIGDESLLEIIYSRIKNSKKVNKIVVACSKSKNDIEIVKLCEKKNISFFQGDENNVLKRYYDAAKKYKFKNIVRITSDCPLIDYTMLDNLIDNFFLRKVDYASNINPPSYPDGFDLEIFSFSALENAYQKVVSNSDKEHVTTYIRKNKKFKKFNLQCSSGNFSNIGLTVDTQKDIQVLKKIYFLNKKKLPKTFKQTLKIINLNNNFFSDIKNHKRNEGYKMIKGQKLWIRAQDVIAGGNSLFSKKPELFLPGRWPAYFKKTKGIEIWDLDNKKYLDFSFMGVGTNILGYNRSEVDVAVKKVIQNGNMSTFNSVEEVFLAEKLLNINPWASKVKFCRTGGEASSVAVRLARAANGKEKVLFSGYHGWHDWYLSSNISSAYNLDKHLMPNIESYGIPKNLRNSSIPFDFNDTEQFKNILNKNKNISAVIMEVQRDRKPKINFLKTVRKLTKDNNIILIFDECTSGFRETFGGIHKKYKINPDIIIYGKALGNGYAVNAVIGADYVMNAVKKTFISSTFWSERIGFAASLATLDTMEKVKSWKIISSLGKEIKRKWKILSKNNNVKIKISGLDAIPRFDFQDKNYHLIYKTFLTQEFLKNKFLATNVIYLSILHKDKKILQNYFDILNEVFYKIGKLKSDIYKKLESPVCIGGLRMHVKKN